MKSVEFLKTADLSFIAVEQATVILKAALGEHAPDWPYGKAKMPNYVAKSLKLYATMGKVHVGDALLAPVFLSDEQYLLALKHGTDSPRVDQCLQEYLKIIKEATIRKRGWVFGPEKIISRLSELFAATGYQTYLHHPCPSDHLFLITLRYGEKEDDPYVPDTVWINNPLIITRS